MYKNYVDKRGKCREVGSGSSSAAAVSGSDPGGRDGREGGGRTGGLNRLALTALNAVNVIAQDGEQSTR